MNVGVLIDRMSIDRNKITNIESGNPGIGGTEFLLLQLFYYLNKRGNVQGTLLTKELLDIPGKQIKVSGLSDIIATVKEENLDILIFTPNFREKEFYEALDESNVAGIAWIHNYICYTDMKNVGQCSAIKQVVFVGKEHCEAYCDDSISNKATYIFNMATPPQIESISVAQKKNTVTYVGALIKAKGFHKLARVWKSVVKEVPDAQLYVIGSGRLYNHNALLGKYGIAEAKYENMFMPYLMEDDKIMSSVHFMGAMGSEKSGVIQQTKVGVANPTGISETFCLSAVEFEGVGIPVIGYKGYGFLDTVKSGKTGILIKTNKELKDAIVMLLKNTSKNVEYGENAINFYCMNFTPDIIMDEWEKLLVDVNNGVIRATKPEYDHLLNDYKWLKLMNRCIQKKMKIESKSIAYMVSYAKECVKSLMRKIK